MPVWYECSNGRVVEHGEGSAQCYLAGQPAGTCADLAAACGDVTRIASYILPTSELLAVRVIGTILSAPTHSRASLPDHLEGPR